MAAEAPFGLTVGIATCNRPDALRRCLASIALIDDLVTEVIVVDDASDPPIDPVLQQVPERQQQRQPERVADLGDRHHQRRRAREVRRGHRGAAEVGAHEAGAHEARVHGHSRRGDAGFEGAVAS